MDGNGQLIPPGGSTSSSTITFEFVALEHGDEETQVDGFQCRLDSDLPADFVDCGTVSENPPVFTHPYTGLKPGPHKFEVRAYVNADDPEFQEISSIKIPQTNNPIVDPTPATLNGNKKI